MTLLPRTLQQSFWSLYRVKGLPRRPKDFMLRLRALCDQHGIKLIADEVQTGAGRTGTFFAMEQMGSRLTSPPLPSPLPVVFRWRE